MPAQADGEVEANGVRARRVEGQERWAEVCDVINIGW